MPVSVRTYFWLSVALVAWGICHTAAFILFPPSHYSATLAQFPADGRETFQLLTMLQLMFLTAVHGLIELVLAALIALWRQGSARWVLIAYYIAERAVPLGYLIHTKLLHPAWRAPQTVWDLAWQHLKTYELQPLSLGFLVFEILLVVLVFTPEARRWFRREPT